VSGVSEMNGLVINLLCLDMHVYTIIAWLVLFMATCDERLNRMASSSLEILIDSIDWKHPSGVGRSHRRTE